MGSESHPTTPWHQHRNSWGRGCPGTGGGTVAPSTAGTQASKILLPHHNQVLTGHGGGASSHPARGERSPWEAGAGGVR